MNEWNYFNYFTEIEEYFWKKRGSHLLVSPLDWANRARPCSDKPLVRK